MHVCGVGGECALLPDYQGPFVMLIPEKLYQKSRLLSNSSKENLGQEHNGRKNPLRPRSQENRDTVYWGRNKRTPSEKKSLGVLASEGVMVFFFFNLPCVLILPLWMCGVFWWGLKYFLRGGLRYGLDCTRVHQLHVLHIYLKTPCTPSKSCFPLNLPSLVEHHIWEVMQVITTCAFFFNY